MKLNLIIPLLFALLSFFSFSQVPQAMNYQAVVRDGNSQILANQNVGIQFVIKQGSATGTSVYTETFDTTSNQYGLINLKIGTGNTVDNFSLIDWPTGPYFLETSMDIAGGTNYTTMGTSEFITVPYVFHAETAVNVLNDNVIDADADSTNELQALSFGNDTLYLSNGNNIFLGQYGIDLVNDADADATNELNTALTLSGTILTITDAGGILDVNLSGLDTQLTEAQVDVFVANNGYITSPNDADADSTNELQALSFSNDTLYLSNGNNIFLGQYGIDLVDDNDADSTNEIQTLTINGNTLGLTGTNNSITLPNNNIWFQNGNNIYYTPGNVGIGTSIPDYTLDVDGDIGVNRYIYHNDDPNEDTYIEFHPNDNFDVWVGGHNALDIGTGFGGTGSTNINSQSVGVPNLPATNLATGDRVVVSNSSGILKTVPTSSFGGGGGGSGLAGSGSTNYMTYWQNNSSLTYTPNIYYDPNTNRLGVGNSNPQEQLHVGGDIGMNQQLVHNGDTDTYIEFHPNGNRIKLVTGGTYFMDLRKSGQAENAWMNADKFIFQKNESAFENTFLEPVANGSGFIGTGLARWNTGYFVGMDLTTAPFISSDSRLKRNIEPLPDATSILMELSPVSYDLIQNRETRNGQKLENFVFENQVGLIAQELDKVLPDLVKKPNELSEHYGVNYTGLIPYLIKAMQEQQAEIELLKIELQKIKAEEK